MKTFILLIVLFTSFLFYTSIYAQTGVIEGSIRDIDNTPIPGATINLGPTYKGDQSDAFGTFRFTNLLAGQYELIASHAGYKTEIIPIEVKNDVVATVSVNLRKGNLDLAEVRLNSKKTNGLNTLSHIDVLLRPVNSSQDVLRVVPGVFIAQHAGGGKAEQIFLRGFDIDHGTDINLTVDGIPVNMVSHAHGQGYADLHFLVPETIEKVNFEMGPYDPSKGNLATAGYVAFKTKDFLKENFIKAEAGRYNTKRLSGQLKLFNKETSKKKEQLYVASEYFHNDSYFESPQDFHRFNVMGKYNAWSGNQSQLTIMASVFDSKWNASGQIPNRAVKNGTITRFGSIDNSEGGNTSRVNFTTRYARQWKNNWKSTDQFFYSRYQFNLYSNFTFFLRDTVNGDAIQQKESRNVFGYTTTAEKTWLLGNKKAVSEFGAGFRFDDADDVSLSKTVKRNFLSDLQRGAIKEGNGFFYWDQQVQITDRLAVDGGLRYDYFRFGYKNLLAGETGFRYQAKAILSPKLNITYSPGTKVRIFINNGIGFHSNDTRVILATDTKDILPKVIATDAGIILKPASTLVLKATAWHLYSQQEFVYVGDEGIVEPGGRTRRMGIDLSARYQVASWLFADVDMNITRARALDAVKGNDFVPLAPSFTSIGGLTVKTKTGWSGSLRYRFIDDRPANEDYSVIATGYLIADAIVNCRIKKIDLFISMENILNRKWNEAQFDTQSRLQNEPGAISEIHYTPGTPGFLKGGISFIF